MAQTKRKRRSKHRGTAAGTIEARGRTSRPPSPAERKKISREEARQIRLNTPPTWRGSFNRAVLACLGVFVVLFLMNTHAKNRLISAFALAVIALLLYVPSGYYLELFMYRRRQAKKAGQPPASRSSGR